MKASKDLPKMIKSILEGEAKFQGGRERVAIHLACLEK